MFLRAAFALAFLLTTAAVSARAVELETIRSDDGFAVLFVTGEFLRTDEEAALVRQVAEGGATVVSFDSPGGNVDAAIRLGRMIRLLGLSTFQTRDADCASACTLAFLGGSRRYAEPGSLGLHRSSFASDLQLEQDAIVAGVQQIVADTMAYVVEMGVDPRLMQVSLSVASEDMRYLTAAEMAEYGVTTDGVNGGLVAGLKPSSALPTGPRPSSDESKVKSKALAPSPPPDLWSADRLAFYSGLDFLGSDIAMEVSPDAPACAARCVGNPQCRAFTFNTLTPIGRGPNCFLKSGQGELDGNTSAVSGRLLSRLEPDAQTYRFGSIDPHTGLYRDRDIPGHDLSSRPLLGADSEFQCRRACVGEATCAAFTFVGTRGECWLKGAVGGVRRMAGTVTGVKLEATFYPTHVPLE